MVSHSAFSLVALLAALGHIAVATAPPVHNVAAREHSEAIPFAVLLENKEVTRTSNTVVKKYSSSPSKRAHGGWNEEENDDEDVDSWPPGGYVQNLTDEYDNASNSDIAKPANSNSVNGAPDDDDEDWKAPGKDEQWDTWNEEKHRWESGKDDDFALTSERKPTTTYYRMASSTPHDEWKESTVEKTPTTTYQRMPSSTPHEWKSTTSHHTKHHKPTTTYDDWESSSTPHEWESMTKHHKPTTKHHKPTTTYNDWEPSTTPHNWEESTTKHHKPTTKHHKPTATYDDWEPSTTSHNWEESTTKHHRPTSKHHKPTKSHHAEMSSQTCECTPSSAPPPPQGKTHIIQVGATQGDPHTYGPRNITANPGDRIEFAFLSGNHTVTQSASFDKPCEPLDGGFKSGFLPVNNSIMSHTPVIFRLKINDTTPIYGYCGQKTPIRHCAEGQVFSINAPLEGDKTFDKFLAVAKLVPLTNDTAAAKVNVAGNLEHEDDEHDGPSAEEFKKLKRNAFIIIGALGGVVVLQLITIVVLAIRGKGAKSGAKYGKVGGASVPLTFKDDVHEDVKPYNPPIYK